MEDKLVADPSNIGMGVTVYNRYLFAVPVKGIITNTNDALSCYQVIFWTDNPGGKNVNKHDGEYFFVRECIVGRDLRGAGATEYIEKRMKKLVGIWKAKGLNGLQAERWITKEPDKTKEAMMVRVECGACGWAIERPVEEHANHPFIACPSCGNSDIKETFRADKEWDSHERDSLQSLRPYRFDLIDPKAMLCLAGIMHDGLKDHEPDGWRELPIEDHLNHAVGHITAYRAGNRELDHLGRAFARLMMAVAEEKEDGTENG